MRTDLPPGLRSHDFARYALFSLPKASAAVAFLRMSRPGRADAEVFLALFLAEVVHLRRWGRPVVGETWIRAGDGVRPSRAAALAVPGGLREDLLSESDVGAMREAWEALDGDPASRDAAAALACLTAEGAPLPWDLLQRTPPGADREDMLGDMAHLQMHGHFGPDR